MRKEHRVTICTSRDIVRARHQGKRLARYAGFPAVGLILIATTISELSRNILSYAKEGEICLRVSQQDTITGIIIIARDQGPGINDIKLALQAGYSTSGNTGLGLCSVDKLMHEYEIDSKPGRGTVVIAKIWNLITPMS